MRSAWRRAKLLVFAVLLAPPAWAAEPDAATRGAARKIATEGVSLLQQGNAELASQKLEKAFELVQAPSIALWSARALVKRGLLVEASERYLQAGRLAPSEGNQQAVQLQAQQDCARELSELSPRVPKMVVSVLGAAQSEVSVSVDGTPLPSALLGEERLVNPGIHSVTGTRGSDRVAEQVTARETQTAQVVLRFQARTVSASAAPTGLANAASTSAASAPDAAGRAADQSRARGGNQTLATVALVVGGVGLLTGGVTGFLALRKHSDLNANPDCTDNQCLQSQKSPVDSLHALRTVSTVSFIAGGVLAGTGLVLLLATPSKRGEQPAGSRLALRIGFTGLSVSQSF